MHTVSTKDMLDLGELVRYVREDEENDFFDNPDAGHIIHKIRNMYALSVGGRTADTDWSMRMTEYEFNMYAKRQCMWQVDPAARYEKQYCGGRLVSRQRGFDHEHVFCAEHVDEARTNY